MTRLRGKPAGVLLALALAVAAGAGVRLYLMGRCSPFGSDSFQYMELARGLAEEGRYESRGSQHPDLSRYPLFPALIAAGAALGLSYENAGRAVSFLASLLIVVPLWHLARAAFGRSAALPAAVVGAVSCAAAGTQTMYPNPLATLLALSAAAALWEAWRSPRLLPALLCGASAALASLTRPEGVLWSIACLSVFALAAARRRAAGRGWRPLLCVAVLVIPTYGLYIGWVSARLHRPCLSPGVEYVSDVREAATYYGVRNFDVKGTSWEERVWSLLDERRAGFVLAEYFETGRFPPADPRWVPPPDPSAPAAAAPENGGTATDWIPSARRRMFIARRSLGLLPGALRSAHLLPAVPVALALFGAWSTLRSRRARGGLVFLCGCGLLTLVPILSHIEDRFLLPGVAFACVLAGRGWAVLDFRLSRWSGWRRGLRAPIHLGLLAGILASTWAHGSVCSRPLRQEDLYRRAAASLAGAPDGGPVLAVHPHVAWFADRPYRRLPLGGADAARDYGRAVGATAVVLNLPTDRERRADLGELLDLPPPPGFRVRARVQNDDGAEIRILEFERGDRR
jgi:4-amino-4-deoxy-L-arabinose transferase-like glycosyltransferase